MKIPMRKSQVLATANSIETPVGRCSSPTTIQFAIRPIISWAAVSNRLGARFETGAATGFGDARKGLAASGTTSARTNDSAGSSATGGVRITRGAVSGVGGDSKVVGNEED